MRSTSSSRWLTRIIGIARRSRRLVDQRQQLLAPFRVERRQRLVEQQGAWAAQQRAADRDALLLAARQLRRPAVEQGADAQQRDDLVEADRGASSARSARRSADSRATEYAETAAAPGTHSRSAAARAAHRRRSAVSNSTSSPRTMRPSSGVISPATTLSSVVLPAPEGPTNASVSRPPRRMSASIFDRRRRCSERGSRSPPRPRRQPRASASEATSATTAMTTATTVRRHIAGFAAGVLRGAVDRGRQGLRLAGNVGDEGDGRAELADRLGEAENQRRRACRARQAAA